MLAVAALLATAVTGCASTAPSEQVGLPLPAEPEPAVLSGPQDAVGSYLDWISYAYRVGESDVASHTMSAEESVRVDSYVQLNKEQGRIIDQRLVSFEPATDSVEATRATIGARERWEYRYLSPDGRRAISRVYRVSYDTTYTVVEREPGVWVVDSVEAKALGEVK